MVSTLLKNISQLGFLFPIIWKTNVPNHQPVYIYIHILCIYIYSVWMFPWIYIKWCSHEFSMSGPNWYSHSSVAHQRDHQQCLRRAVRSEDADRWRLALAQAALSLGADGTDSTNHWRSLRCHWDMDWFSRDLQESTCQIRYRISIGVRLIP